MIVCWGLFGIPKQFLIDDFAELSDVRIIDEDLKFCKFFPSILIYCFGFNI